MTYVKYRNEFNEISVLQCDYELNETDSNTEIITKEQYEELLVQLENERKKREDYTNKIISRDGYGVINRPHSKTANIRTFLNNLNIGNISIFGLIEGIDNIKDQISIPVLFESNNFKASIEIVEDSKLIISVGSFFIGLKYFKELGRFSGALFLNNTVEKYKIVKLCNSISIADEYISYTLSSDTNGFNITLDVLKDNDFDYEIKMYSL